MSGSIVTALRPLLVELACSPELHELLRSPELRPLIDVLRDALGPASKPVVEYTSVRESADALGLCPATVRSAVRDGRLEAVRIGRTIRVRRGAVIQPAATGRAAPAATPSEIAKRILGRSARGSR